MVTYMLIEVIPEAPEEPTVNRFPCPVCRQPLTEVEADWVRCSRCGATCTAEEVDTCCN